MPMPTPPGLSPAEHADRLRRDLAAIDRQVVEAEVELAALKAQRHELTCQLILATQQERYGKPAGDGPAVYEPPARRE